MKILEKSSPCKVNLLLNILSKRTDGFHELETVMHPVELFDQLRFELAGPGIELSCNEPGLPTDSRNLVYRAASLFFETTGIAAGVRLRLEKRIPLAAGLGGGSGNAAVTLLGLNELFDEPLTPDSRHRVAAALGSDVPFFLQNKPALGTGRGEQIQPLDFFPALSGMAFLLIHPGFGIPTAWAYQQLARFPKALNGTPGRARRLIAQLRGSRFPGAEAEFYNSLESPALEKYPLLVLYQEFLRENGAAATLMSGSGSTTFALVPAGEAEELAEKFRGKFGESSWMAIVPIGNGAKPQAP